MNPLEKKSIHRRPEKALTAEVPEEERLVARTTRKSRC